MAVKLTGNGVYYHRTTGLPASGTAWTICGWAQSASFAGPPHVLMTMRTAASTIQFELIHHTGASQMVLDGSARVAFASRPATGEWFFFWVQCSGSGAGAMTAGWIRRGDASPVTVSAQISNSGVPGNLYMGGSAGDPSDTRFAAVKMWDAVLTSAELENERWQILPRKTASLLFFTPMVDATLASNVIDYSGNAVDWTANGSAAVEDGPPISWGAPSIAHPFTAPVAAGVVDATLDAVTSSAAGVLALAGATSKTLADLVSNGAGAVSIAGVLSKTLADATLSATGKVALAGASAPTLGDATLSATGVLALKGAATITLETVGLSATGINSSPVTGTLGVTLESLGITATGRIGGWAPVPPEAETWSPVSTTGEVWTPVAPTSESWSDA